MIYHSRYLYIAFLFQLQNINGRPAVKLSQSQRMSNDAFGQHLFLWSLKWIWGALKYTNFAIASFVYCINFSHPEKEILLFNLKIRNMWLRNAWPDVEWWGITPYQILTKSIWSRNAEDAKMIEIDDWLTSVSILTGQQKQNMA